MEKMNRFKRYQVMLEPWQATYLREIKTKSISEALRITICQFILSKKIKMSPEDLSFYARQKIKG